MLRCVACTSRNHNLKVGFRAGPGGGLLRSASSTSTSNRFVGVNFAKQQHTTTTTHTQTQTRHFAHGTSPGEGPKQLHSVARRGPVSWTSLGLVAVVSAAAVGYFKVQRERRLEEAIGKIVTSESDGWSPDKENFAPRKFYQTEDGKWLPRRDQWGGCEFVYPAVCFTCGLHTVGLMQCIYIYVLFFLSF
jgi:hypothetical protein